jgi:hypothetical protein
LRPLPACSGIEVVTAATIAPVPSYWQSLSVIAARITASCQSTGMDRKRTHSRQ